MLNKLRESQENEEGFTLIELLVVVIIIGILAAIAIPTFLNQRENAWVSSAESDVRSAALEVESFMTASATQAYPADNAAFQALDIEVSPGVTLVYSLDTDGNSYCITGNHAQITAAGNDAAYDSDEGGLQADQACTDS